MLACSSWNDDAYEFALENQAGQGLRFEDPQDRKALVMGLALHEQGKQTLNKVPEEPPLPAHTQAPSHHPSLSSCPSHWLAVLLLALALFHQGRQTISKVMSPSHSEPSKALSVFMQLL